MSKRPETKETVLLALELLRRIPRGRKVSAKELHEQLADTEVARDIRTIQRQLEMLSGHFDIERDDTNKPYGYRWKEKAQGLALPMLSDQESLLLTLAEQHLRGILPASLMKSMDGFFTQARTNLDPYANTGAQREREWLSKVRVISTTQPLLPPKIKPGVFEQVSSALFGNFWLKLNYKNAEGVISQIEVMPLGLAQQGPRIYLVCRYRDYDNERSLALHRIISAESSAQHFDRPKNFNFKKYDDDGRFGFGQGKRIKLSFQITKNAGYHLLESMLAEDQQVVELKDGYEITATVVETAQLEWWLRGFGDAVKRIKKEYLA